MVREQSSNLKTEFEVSTQAIDRSGDGMASITFCMNEYVKQIDIVENKFDRICSLIEIHREVTYLMLGNHVESRGESDKN